MMANRHDSALTCTFAVRRRPASSGQIPKSRAECATPQSAPTGTLRGMTGCQWLIVAGGLLQIGGVAALITDIVRTRNALTLYDQRPQTHYASATMRGRGSMTGTLTTGREPTVDERVTAIEQRLANLPAELDDREATFENYMRGVIAGGLKATDAAIQEQRQNMEVLVHGVAGSVIWRSASVAAIILGIALQTVGGAIAAR